MLDDLKILAMRGGLRYPHLCWAPLKSAVLIAPEGIAMLLNSARRSFAYEDVRSIEEVFVENHE